MFGQFENFPCVVFVLLVLHANGAIRSMKFLLNLINLNDEVSTKLDSFSHSVPLPGPPLSSCDKSK